MLDDKRFAELMRKSRLEMPFSDFEDKVMLKIEETVVTKRSILKDINLYALFFILGTGCGTAASFFLPDVLSSLSGVSADNIQLIFQGVFVLVVLTQLDKLIKLVRKYANG